MAILSYPFTRIIFVCLAVALSITSGGCAIRSTKTMDASALVTVRNDRFELAVSASTGRVVRYGPLGGPNLLWQNVEADRTKSPFPGWKNWGGDKVWLWPEEDWKVWSGVEKPHPPGDPAAGSYEVVVTGRRIQMTSPVISTYGVRVVREIVLDDGESSGVTLINRVEKVSSTKTGLPVAPWTVTQVPASPMLYATLAPDAAPGAFAPFPPNDWPGARADGRVVVVPRHPAPWMKMGFDANSLGVPVEGWLFRVSMIGHDADASKWQPLRRAQVFSDPDQSIFRPAGLGPYVEMEFTAPPKTLKPGQSNSLTTRWELTDLRGADVLMLMSQTPSAPVKSQLAR